MNDPVPFEEWVRDFIEPGTSGSAMVRGAYDAASEMMLVEWHSTFSAVLRASVSVSASYNAARPLSGESKPTNPKDAVGISKSPLSVIPSPFLHSLGLAMLEGSLKYGRHNYREAGIRYSVYYDAMMRHMNAWWEGEDIDPESGLPHPVKAAACCAILFDALLQENGNDDRPPKSPPGWMDEANRLTQELLAKYPNPKAPFREIPDSPPPEKT